MERIYEERFAGFEIVNSDLMSKVQGGKSNFLKRIFNFITQYLKELIEGFWRGWNDKDINFSF